MEKQVIAKDKGYAWVAVIGIILTNLFGLGISTYGNLPVLVYLWMERYGLTAQQVGLASSLISLTIYIPGPIYSLVIHAVGSWKSQLTAAVLLAAGFAVLAHANQLWQIIIGYSLLTGMGAAMGQISSVVIIEEYFHVQKDKVWTLMIAAYSAGVTVAPTLLEFLIRNLGYKLALLTLGGIITFANFLAAFIFFGRQICICCPTTESVNGSKCDSKISDSSSISSVSASEIDLEEKFNESQDSNVKQVPEKSNPMKSRLIKSLVHQKEILKCPIFLILLVHYVFITAGESIGLTYAIESAIQSGYADLPQATLAPTLNGIACIITSVAMALLSKYNKHPLVLSSIFAILLGLSVLAIPFVTHLAIYYVLNFIFGIGISGFLSCIMFNLTQLFGKSTTTIHRAAYIFLAIGVGLLIGPLVVGDAIKLLGSTNVAFYFAGAIGLASVLFIFPLWIRVRFSAKQNSETTDELKTENGTEGSTGHASQGSESSKT